MPTVSKCCWAKSAYLTEYICVCVCIHLHISAGMDSSRGNTRLQDLAETSSHLTSYFPIICCFLPLFLFFCLSWHRPSGCKAKWSVSEEGHPLSVVFRTNTAAAFPLLYPSVGFGSLLWTTAQIWAGFSKQACTAARALYTGLFCKYCQQQLNVGMEPESGAFGQWDG